MGEGSNPGRIVAPPRPLAGEGGRGGGGFRKRKVLNKNLGGFMRHFFMPVFRAAMLVFPAAPLFAALPEYTVKRATEKIVLDGILDEDDWKAAPSFGDFVFPWYTS